MHEITSKSCSCFVNWLQCNQQRDIEQLYYHSHIMLKSKNVISIFMSPIDRVTRWSNFFF
jgi:hypothetical protein